jgi:hypothetical protein
LTDRKPRTKTAWLRSRADVQKLSRHQCRSLLDAERASLCCAQILTKSITAAVLNAIGDLIAQFAVEKKDKLDVGRFVRFAALVSGSSAACMKDGSDMDSGTKTAGRCCASLAACLT